MPDWPGKDGDRLARRAFFSRLDRFRTLSELSILTLSQPQPYHLLLLKKKKKKKKKKTFQTAPVNAVTFDELQGLTYLQVKGSGIANTCPVIEEGTSDLKAVKAGNYKIEKFCMEPTSFTVKEESAFKGGEPEFVKTRLMTRLTYTLDEISGQFKVDGSGNGELNWLFLPFLGGKEQGRGARARWFFLVVFSSFEVSRKRGENSHPSLFPLSL